MVRPIHEGDIGLHMYYEPPADGDPETIVDVVAIHGIGAHPDDTWCKAVTDSGVAEEKRYINWLKDKHMLPAVIPNAHILLYGYESKWFGDEAITIRVSTIAHTLLVALKRTRKACPTRPLLFIAHCFGGLVVLKALVDSRHPDSQWHETYKSTTGLLFLGTPFRGASGLNQAELLQAAQSQYQEGLVQGAVLNVLAPGNENLLDLMDAFAETRKDDHKAHIACFWERKPSNVGKIIQNKRIERFVVDEGSGCLDQSDVIGKYSLSRDHYNMNKFATSTEEDYLTVTEVIGNMATTAHSIVLARSQKVKPFHSSSSKAAFLQQPGQDAEMVTNYQIHGGVHSHGGPQFNQGTFRGNVYFGNSGASE